MSQLIAFLIAVAIAAAGSQEPAKTVVPSQAKKKGHTMTVSEVLKKNTDTWMKVPGVLGTGEGRSDGKPCIMIFVETNVSSVKKQIPSEVEGYKVLFEQTGTIKALKTSSP